MDQATYSKELLIRVKDAIEDFAAKKGWKSGTYRTYVSIDENWDQYYVAFIVPEPLGPEERPPVREAVMAKKPREAALPDEYDVGDPEFDGSGAFVSLWIITRDQFKQGGIYALNPEYRPIDEYLK
jgi:hypothetical protein